MVVIFIKSISILTQCPDPIGLSLTCLTNKTVNSDMQMGHVSMRNDYKGNFSTIIFHQFRTDHTILWVNVSRKSNFNQLKLHSRARYRNGLL